MTGLPSSETQLVPRADTPTTGVARGSTGIPADLLSQAANRLRVLAFVYAVTFFLAGFFPALLLEEGRRMLFSDVKYWLPGVSSIAVALVVAGVAGSSRVAVSTVMVIGMVFEVSASYGIAAAEFLDPGWLTPDLRWVGLSWVAVWTLLFTVVVPASPRRAIVASLLSVSAVPVVVAVSLLMHPEAFRPSGLGFFFSLVFPYLIVVGMAYIASRVVYSLGAEVKRARQLGSYQLVEKLGQGGMGEVWRAKHRLLARPAAIKLIRPSLTVTGQEGATLDLQRRFEREAQVIASLRSPHTVNLFDFGVADDGAFYYVMELLEGLDAETLVREFGPLPYQRVIHVLRQVCHSLSEAEALNLVHRDVKPANIFLCKYGEEFDFVKVLDFGLVKALKERPDADTLQTRAHVIHGTPAYIAPEQALGASDLDGRVDIYALGCVGYWLLTGHHVFKADTTLALLMHHAQTPPMAPSERTELDVPAPLDALILACLEKDRAHRPQTAKDLSRRLSEIEGAHAWTEDHARRWWVNNQPGASAARSDDAGYAETRL